MKTPIRSFRVAAAGLDLLHQTRLKLACSLLLSERMDVGLHGWSDAPADLLVLGLDHPDATAALAQARQRGVPTLRIGREIGSATAGALPHGATVRDLNEQLRDLLGSSPATAPADAGDAATGAGTPLLMQLVRLDAPDTGMHLLQRGAISVAVDPRTHSIALPPALTLAELAAQLDDSAWSISALDAADFQHQYAYRLPQRQSFEALHFAIARYRPELLPAPTGATPLKLRHWPDLGADDVPTTWLLAIACLHARPWQAAALAKACQMPRDTMESLFSAAFASGLALPQEQPVDQPQRRRGASDSRFFSWVARRFGLNLFQGAQP